MRIAGAAFDSGVVFAGVIAASGWITNQPYCDVLTGFRSTPVLAVGAKTAASNSATSLPLVAVNLPPLSFEPGSCEYCFASAAKLAPSLQLRVDLVGERLLVLADEDLLDLREAACSYCDGSPRSRRRWRPG